MSIRELIANLGDRLTPTERRIAEAVIADPTLLAFGTVSDLATRVGTSRPSIVRFATKLGFDGYPELQSSARDGVARQLATPSQRIRQRQDQAGRVHQEIERSIHETLERLDEERLDRLTTDFAQARRVWILSGETSRAGAQVLESGLSMIRDGVHLVEAHNLGRDLSGASKGDVSVVFDFARYRRETVLAARALVAIGVPLIAITDGPLSPLAPIATSWCELRVPGVGPFDSSLPAVLAAEMIVLEVASQLGPAATQRIDRLEQFWDSTGTFFDESV